MTIAERIRNKIIFEVSKVQKTLKLYDLQLRYRFAKSGNSNEVGYVTIEQEQKQPDLIPNMSPDHVVESARTGKTRWCGVNGYEGLALDDALVYLDKHKYFSFLPLARALSNICKAYISPKFSVLEMGCGSGCLFEFIRNYGCNFYTGLDINKIAFENSPIIQGSTNNFMLADLQEQFDLQKKYDLVCTFEVLEHIREDKLDNFIRNIAQHMHDGGIFAGTASLQEFDVHITVHPKAWWLERFKRFGLIEHPRHEELERELAESHPFNWEAQNTNIFVLIKNPKAAS